jgi:tetratricopeptide (TPR) repeat protein
MENTGRAAFREVMEDFPEEGGRAALFLGDSYLKEGEIEKAKTAYHQARLFYPEVAARAQILFGEINRGQGDFSSAVSDLSLVLDLLGIDGFFSEYRYRGNIMEEASELITESIRAEGNPEYAVEHLRGLIERYPGSNVGLTLQFQLADFYASEAKSDLALAVLDRIISQYPKSFYTPRAYLKKAGIVLNPDALAIYETLRKAFPRSRYWVKATRGLATTCLELAERSSDEKEKRRWRSRAATATREIIRKYPRSPEAVEAGEFLASHQL